MKEGFWGFASKHPFITSWMLADIIVGVCNLACIIMGKEPIGKSGLVNVNVGPSKKDEQEDSSDA